MTFWLLILTLIFPFHSTQGAACLARSLKVVNEALTSLDLGFNEIRVWTFCFVNFLVNFSSM